MCTFAWAYPLQMPLAAESAPKIEPTYLFGTTMQGELPVHHGIELPALYGTAVGAAADGQVVFADNDRQLLVGAHKNFYGNLVIIQHQLAHETTPEVVYTLYGHLSKVDVQVGQAVRAGDIIGAVGIGGASFGAHLHFEVRLGENSYASTVNPALWLPPHATEMGQMGLLAGRLVNAKGLAMAGETLTLDRLEEGQMVKRYYVSTYADEKLLGCCGLDENFVLPDLPPGQYRLTYVNLKVYEYNFEVFAGKISFIMINFED